MKPEIVIDITIGDASLHMVNGYAYAFIMLHALFVIGLITIIVKLLSPEGL